MKKLETLTKALETITPAALAAIINNEDAVDAEHLTPNEQFAVLIFDELARALKTKEHVLVLDCNYAQSKNDIPKVDYFRLVSNDTKNQSMIQVYVHANAKAGTVNFALCTSCARVNREQFIALADDLKFVIKCDSRTGRAKTSQRTGISYDDIVPVVKSVCAVLANGSKTGPAAPDNNNPPVE